MLLHAPFLDEAVAAKDLHAGVGGNVPVVGQKGFDDGREQGHHLSRILAHLFVGVVKFLVDQHGAKNHQRPAAFGIGFGSQQHLAHIGVHDDRVGRLVFGLGA